MTHRIANLIVVVILSACAREGTVHSPDTSNPIPDSVIGDADDESRPPMEDSAVFSCNPRSLRLRDTLTLQLAVPHGGELMVLTPSDVYFSVVYPPDDPTGKFSIARSEEFKTMSTLKIPADIRLPPRVFGKDTIPEAVFTSAGQYLLQMGDRMESDHTGPPYICKVMFTP